MSLLPSTGATRDLGRISNPTARELEIDRERRQRDILTRWYKLRKLGKLNDLRLKLMDCGVINRLAIGSEGVESALCSPEWERTTLDYVESRVLAEEASVNVESTISQILRRVPG